MGSGNCKVPSQWKGWLLLGAKTPGPSRAGVGLGPTRAPISKGIMLQKKAERQRSGLTERAAWYSPPDLLINSQD